MTNFCNFKLCICFKCLSPQSAFCSLSLFFVFIYLLFVCLLPKQRFLFVNLSSPPPYIYLSRSTQVNMYRLFSVSALNPQGLSSPHLLGPRENDSPAVRLQKHLKDQYPKRSSVFNIETLSGVASYTQIRTCVLEKFVRFSVYTFKYSVLSPRPDKCGKSERENYATSFLFL